MKDPVDSFQNPLHPLAASSVVVLGNIDGFHRGHQALLGEGRRLASHSKVPLWVATFDPHPAAVLRPQVPFQRIFPIECQKRQLLQAGAQGIHHFSFTSEFSKISAADFLDRELSPRFQPKAVVVGFNFRFGHDRQGDPEFLKAWGARRGIEVSVVAPVLVKDQAVSSSQIRKLLQIGDVRGAADLLGFPFFIEGLVENGAGRGAGLGFPTANMKAPPSLLPMFGVYATRLITEGNSFPSISHLGPLPTFGDAQARCETHVLGQRIELRGQMIRVEFVERVREVMKFDSAEQLKAQIGKDLQQAREIHGLRV